MNCLLLESDELDSWTGLARVTGRRLRHADEILKAREGDTLAVGVVGGALGRGEIVHLDRESLELRVELDQDPPPKLPLTLVLALPRPPVFRRLLSTVASLGIARLWIVGTARTEKSFWQSHVVEENEIRARLLLGLEQSRDTVLPEVEIHRYFEPLVTEQLPRAVRSGRAFLAHPTGERSCPHAVAGAATLFVGPEGGFLDFEVEKLCGIGFECVSVGERALRVEPVVSLLVGRLME